MPSTRPPYPPEFRLEAVRMLRAGMRSPKQLAVELGCAEQTLRNWLRQDQADRGEREDVLSSEERAPRPWVRARGTRSARPVRRHATSSRLRAPRPWT